ncbi:MAG: LamG domain-containing protein [Planctomycetes bacterium]|nr:LamG domain-containing protein [Planctomycetota bacterium]
MQSGLAASRKGLYIGAGSTLAVGTFWKGLIDDVRIYKRVVKP